MDKKLFARKAGLQDPEKGYDIEAMSRAAAAKIPYQLMRGIPFQPKYYDTPKIFAEVLFAWMNGPGRKVADPALSQQIEQVWMFYTEWAIQLEMGMSAGMPAIPGQGASQPGSDQSAPGGSANNAGHIGSDQQNVGADAQRTVQQADRTGEKAAQVSANREG